MKSSHLYLASIILLISIGVQSQTTENRPNIIYILADDLGYSELGVYGQKKIETPNIDALASRGMRFTQHYSGAPVCAPARASLLTGKHMGHSYIRGNDEWQQRGANPRDVWDYRKMEKDSTLEGQRPLPKNTVMIPKLLKKAGYTTAMFGKWGLGAPQTQSIPTTMGFDYFFGYNGQRQAHTYTPLHLYENEHRYHLANDTVAPSTKLDKNADPYDIASYKKYTQPFYAPQVSFDKMISFVDRAAAPFFIYWASPIPHVPLQAPKRWVDYYRKKFGDEPPYVGSKGYFPNRYPKATYAAMISYLDENIGKLIAHLKATGKYDNTLIVFTSDNGPTYNGGSHSLWFESAKPFRSDYGRGKGFVYEGGIRVPLIVEWPQHIKPGTSSDHIAAFWDWMPTLCDIAKVPVPKTTDGISFYNTLLGKKHQKEHDYLYWEFPEQKGQVAVRMGPWKFIWKNIKEGNKNVELYNLRDDIGEQHDIASQHPDLIKKFYKIIKKEHTTPAIDKFKIPALETLHK